MHPRFLALALFLLPACGGSSDPKALTDEGSKALNSGDYAKAAESFDEAVAALGTDTSSPEWLRAKLGGIKARAFTDPERAKNDFLQLAASHPSKVTENDFSLVGSKLGEANHLGEAIAVLKAGMEAHNESPHLKALMDDLGKKAEASGDAGALDSLKGLGYAGGD